MIADETLNQFRHEVSLLAGKYAPSKATRPTLYSIDDHPQRYSNLSQACRKNGSGSVNERLHLTLVAGGHEQVRAVHFRGRETVITTKVRNRDGKPHC